MLGAGHEEDGMKLSGVSLGELAISVAVLVILMGVAVGLYMVVFD